jgi:hypothetical protein
MTSPVSETGTRNKSALQLTVLVVLALAVWGVGVWLRAGERQPQPIQPPIVSGTASSLAQRINAAPRALVFVGCPACTQATRARHFFSDAAAQIAEVRPGVVFFVIEDETTDDARAWAATFRQEDLAMFGHLGNGWVLWVEGGQIREVDSSVGVQGRTTRDIVERTLVVWP